MGTREFEGLGPGHALVKPVAGANLSAVRLTAQEGFVYSRADGTLTLEALCMVTGLGEAATAEILRRLRGLGLIVIGAEGPRGNAQPEPADECDRDEDTVRTEIPNWFSQAGEPEAPPRQESPSAGSRTFPPEQTGPKPRRIVLPADESGIDLKPESRARIREAYERLQEKNFFELLEVSPHADPTELKRAYFLRSKEFHPDRYYTKQLGAYKEMLDEIFKQVSAAYRFLEEEEQRNSYREMVLQDAEQASALRKVEEQAAQAITDDAQEQSKPSPASPPSHEYRMSRSDVHRAVSDEEQAERPARLDLPRRPSPFAKKPPAPPQAPSETGNYSKLSPEEQRERDRRREEDRKRRMSKVTSAFLGRAQRAQIFYEQGLRQLAANQVLAAAASLKLAVTFGAETPAYRRAYDEAVEKSRTLTAENYFKRGIFEESVGRMELAGRAFLQAAEALPTKALYLCRAAEALFAAQDLIKAKDYATRAVQIDGNSVDARIVLGQIYNALRMAKNARRELQQALKLDPGNTLAKDLLKRIKD